MFLETEKLAACVFTLALQDRFTVDEPHTSISPKSSFCRLFKRVLARVDPDQDPHLEATTVYSLPPDYPGAQLLTRLLKTSSCLSTDLLFCLQVQKGSGL